MRRPLIAAALLLGVLGLTACSDSGSSEQSVAEACAAILPTQQALGTAVAEGLELVDSDGNAAMVKLTEAEAQARKLSGMATNTEVSAAVEQLVSGTSELATTLGNLMANPATATPDDVQAATDRFGTAITPLYTLCSA